MIIVYSYTLHGKGICASRCSCTASTYYEPLPGSFLFLFCFYYCFFYMCKLKNILTCILSFCPTETLKIFVENAASLLMSAEKWEEMRLVRDEADMQQRFVLESNWGYCGWCLNPSTTLVVSTQTCIYIQDWAKFETLKVYFSAFLAHPHHQEPGLYVGKGEGFWFK